LPLCPGSVMMWRRSLVDYMIRRQCYIWTAVWGVARPQGGRLAAIFFPLGYPFPYGPGHGPVCPSLCGSLDTLYATIVFRQNHMKSLYPSRLAGLRLGSRQLLAGHGHGRHGRHGRHGGQGRGGESKSLKYQSLSWFTTAGRWCGNAGV
jgi:hypothetical protein